MLITAVAALILGAIRYYQNKNVALFIVAVSLILLSGFMFYEIVPVILQRRRSCA